ncbi:MAG TPA: hypothetical protein VMV94_19620 [Phycisphaerae bacterium]|nr:hypothetical protein [Phycisphaerae bacterium]
MPGGFVSDNPDVMQDYTYMADHMGNITGLVDSVTGTAKRQALDVPGTQSAIAKRPPSPRRWLARQGQVFDAFGVNVGGYITFRCAADHDYAEMPWHEHCGYWRCWPWLGSEWGNGSCVNGGGIELVGEDPGVPDPGGTVNSYYERVGSRCDEASKRLPTLH